MIIGPRNGSLLHPHQKKPRPKKSTQTTFHISIPFNHHPHWQKNGLVGNRTPDLAHAKRALYRLSYKPRDNGKFSSVRSYSITHMVQIMGKG